MNGCIRLSNAGRAVSPDAFRWQVTARLDVRTRRMWTGPLLAGMAVPYDDALAAAHQCRYLGHADWQLMRLDDWQGLLDSTRRHPDLLRECFDARADAFGWTRSPAAPAAAQVLGVSLLWGHTIVAEPGQDRLRVVVCRSAPEFS